MKIEKEKLELLQMFFVKSFVISIILLIISSFLCVAMHDIQLTIVNKFFNLNEEALNWIVISWLSFWKILIVQFTLIPAIAIWAMRHCCKCKCGE